MSDSCSQGSRRNLIVTLPGSKNEIIVFLINEASTKNAGMATKCLIF